MRKRKELLKEFKLEYYEEGGRTKTRVVYCGDYFVLDMEESKIKRIRIEMIIYSVLLNALLFGSLFIDTLSGHKVYVVILQFLSFAMGMVSIYFLFPFILGVRKFNSRQKEDVIIAPKGYMMSKTILLIATVIARMVFLILDRNNYIISTEIILFSICLLGILICLREMLLVMSIKIRIEENPNKPKEIPVEDKKTNSEKTE